MKTMKIILLYVFLVSINCGSNLPLRTSRTLPGGVSYQHLSLETSNTEATATVNDTLVNFDNNIPSFTYSYRRGLFKWLEFEISGGITPASGLGHLWFKLPLTKNSMGTGVPYIKNPSRFSSSFALGAFLHGFERSGARGGVQAGIYDSYDLFYSSNRDFQLVLNNGLEYIRGVTEIDKLIYRDEEYEGKMSSTFIGYDWVEAYYNAIQIPVGLGIIIKRFFISIDYRYIVPFNSKVSFYNGVSHSDYKNIKIDENSIMTISVGYSCNLREILYKKE